MELEYKKLLKKVMIRVELVLLNEDVTQTNIFGEIETFSNSNNMLNIFSYTPVKLNEQGNFVERGNQSDQVKLITKESLEQLLEVDDNVYVGLIDCGMTMARVPESKYYQLPNSDIVMLNAGELLVNKGTEDSFIVSEEELELHYTARE